MNLGYFALGVAVLLVVSIDILWTTLWVEGGAGPLTSRLMAGTWHTVRRVGQGKPRVLSLAGPLVLIVSLTTWISLLWIGWTVVFAAPDNLLIDTVNRGEVSWPDLLYFTGYTVFTLGIGDFVPRDGLWQVVTILAAASGLLFVTLTVTYLLSVLGAVTQKRAFASGVSGLGQSGSDIVLTSWNGNAFDDLEVPIVTLATQLNTLTTNHNAYPILHYFYSTDSWQAPAHNIVVLDEALTLLSFGVTSERRPNTLVLRTARTSVERYLETLHEVFIESATDPPPPADIDSLREAGIPAVADEEFVDSLRQIETRRRLLRGLVESEARQWPS